MDLQNLREMGQGNNEKRSGITICEEKIHTPIVEIALFLAQIRN